jgi:hypothetical protein
MGWCKGLVQRAGAKGWCKGLVQRAGAKGWCRRLVQALVTMPNGRRLKKRPLATGRCSPLCCFAGRFLRRSLSSQRIAPDPRWATHVQRPSARNARTRRSHVVTAARISQRCMGMASLRRDGPHTCRILTAIQWQPRRVTNRQSDDPGPCRRCAAALSCSADAPLYHTLGSHAKSGPRLRRSPQTAVPCGHRNRASLSPTDAPEPTAWRRGSTHPDHCLRGWNRVASPRRDGRIPAGFRRPSDADTKSPESSTR